MTTQVASAGGAPAGSGEALAAGQLPRLGVGAEDRDAGRIVRNVGEAAVGVLQPSDQRRVEERRAVPDVRRPTRIVANRCRERCVDRDLPPADVGRKRHLEFADVVIVRQVDFGVRGGAEFFRLRGGAAERREVPAAVDVLERIERTFAHFAQAVIARDIAFGERARADPRFLAHAIDEPGRVALPVREDAARRGAARDVRRIGDLVAIADQHEIVVRTIREAGDEVIALAPFVDPRVLARGMRIRERRRCARASARTARSRSRTTNGFAVPRNVNGASHSTKRSTTASRISNRSSSRSSSS